MVTSGEYIGIFLQFLVAIGFVMGTMAITHLIGPSRKTDDKLESFECGVEAQGNARTPFSIKYFLTAILFVLFDVEIIFMYPWAVNFDALGTQGFVKMLIFLAPFILGLFYVYKKGAFKWE